MKQYHCSVATNWIKSKSCNSRIYNEFIVIAEDSTNTDLITDLSTIDCFYHVYGERKDINPLIVEYEGKTWQDYPDPNFDPNKVDEDKRTYTDPQFAGPPNTYTA